jgi:cytochrome c5
MAIMAAQVSWPTIGLPVSKHDTHFFNTFSMVIGGLIVVALLIFALARVVAGRTQEPQVYADAKYVASVEERIKPFAREAVAGADNSAMAIQAPPQAASIALAVPKDGASLYEAVCKNCHDAGLVGAPKFGDRAAWAPRIAKGKPALYEHALKGFNAMPAKGARTDLSDELIRAGVDYLVQKGS